MFEIIQNELKRYDFITLKEMEAVKLMNRMDTKYLVRIDAAARLLNVLSDDYRALDVAGQRSGEYRSQYYDTSDLQMLHAHITGRYPRFKVRERHYSQNGLSFFEIKQKSNNGRTSKKRLPASRENSDAIETLLYSQTTFDINELQCALVNRFDRITLVNNAKTERVTFDFNLQFDSPCGQQTLSYPQSVVIEVKQNRRSESAITALLRQTGIRPSGMSKYCVGMLLVNRMESCKRYKPNLRGFLNLQYI